ncbi:MAG TPA: hypothetical protein VIL26_03890 [Clostridia bacterium]
MKKFLISMLTLVMSVGLFASVFGCGKPATSSATAYDLVNAEGSYYFVVVDITVNKEGKVSAIKLDEVLLTDRWTKQGGQNSAITDTVTSTDGEATFAKYIRIGDKKFEATAVNGSGNHATPVYAEIGGEIDNLVEDMMGNKDLVKYYYEAAKNGNFKILKKFGDNFVDEYDGANNSYTSLFKSTSNYWPAGSNGMGWKANMEAMENYVKENGVNYTSADLEGITRDNDNKIYIGDVNTGATLTGFVGYMTVVKAAYDKAMKVYA